MLKRSFLYICIMGFSGNLYQVWRSCPTCIYFCIKGGCHRVTSDGEIDIGCLASGTDLVLFLTFTLLHDYVLCIPLKLVHGSFYLGLHPQLLSLLHFHLSLVLCLLGAPSRQCLFPIQSSFQASFLQQKVFLPSWSFHFSWGSGVEGMAK